MGTALKVEFQPEFLDQYKAASTHYGNPADGCMSDEIEVQVQGVKGDFCSPECGVVKKCPTDVPDGVTAQPQCALKDSSTEKKYCALICKPPANECNLHSAYAPTLTELVSHTSVDRALRGLFYFNIFGPFVLIYFP